MSVLWQGLNWFQRACLMAMPVLTVFTALALVETRRFGTRLRQSSDALPEIAIRHVIQYRIIETLCSFVQAVAAMSIVVFEGSREIYHPVAAILIILCMMAVPPLARRRLRIHIEPTDTVATGWVGKALCYLSYSALIVLLTAAGFVGLAISSSSTLLPGVIVLVVSGAGIAVCVWRMAAEHTLKG